MISFYSVFEVIFPPATHFFLSKYFTIYFCSKPATRIGRRWFNVQISNTAPSLLLSLHTTTNNHYILPLPAKHQTPNTKHHRQAQVSRRLAVVLNLAHSKLNKLTTWTRSPHHRTRTVSLPWQIAPCQQPFPQRRPDFSSRQQPPPPQLNYYCYY
jgi:hypothetical protein